MSDDDNDEDQEDQEELDATEASPQPVLPAQDGNKWWEDAPLAQQQSQSPENKWWEAAPLAKEQPQASEGQWWEAAPLAKPSESEHEGGLGTTLRELAHGALPLAAAVGTGALAGSVFPGLGTVAGAAVGLGSALAGGAAASYAQEKALDLAGKSDAAQRAANAKAHPYYSLAGELLPAVAAFNVGKGLQPIVRGAGAILGGGLEAAQEAAQGHEFDPTRIAANAATMGTFVSPNRLGRAIAGVGERLGERIRPGRPDQAGTPEAPVGAPAPEEVPGELPRAEQKASAEAVGGGTAPLNSRGNATVNAPPVDLPKPDAPGKGYNIERGEFGREGAKEPEGGRQGGQIERLDADGVSEEQAAALLASHPSPSIEAVQQGAARQAQGQLAPEPQPPTAPAAAEARPVPPEGPELDNLVQRATQLAARRPVKVVSDLPEAGNASYDPKGPVLIHKDIPKSARPFIKVHETVEGEAMKAGYDYDTAHAIATEAEKKAVGKAGLDWDAYEHKVDHGAEEARKGPPSPPELDTEKHVTSDRAFDLPEGTPIAPTAAEQSATRGSIPTERAQLPERPESERSGRFSEAAKNFWSDKSGAFLMPSGAELKKFFAPLSRIKSFVAPQTMGPKAQVAAKGIVSSQGLAARSIDITKHTLEPYVREIMGHAPGDRIEFMHYMERERNDLPQSMSPRMYQLADVLREAFDLRKTQLGYLDKTAAMDFVQDYFPHMWKDPVAAQKFAAGWGGKMGSTGSLNKRTIPTIREGLAQNLELTSDNPVEVAMHYFNSMDKMIAMADRMAIDHKAGETKFLRSGVVGATGNPYPANKRDPKYADWVELNGPGTKRDVAIPTKNPDGTPGEPKVIHMQLYAPPGYAAVWNSFMDRGFLKTPEGATIYNGARRASNAITGLQLGFNLYHASTMATESLVSLTDLALNKLFSGNIAGGLKDLAVSSTVLGPTAQGYVKGQRLVQASRMTPASGVDRYMQALGLVKPRNIEDEKLATYHALGGGRTGRTGAADYDYSKAGAIWQSIARGTLMNELKQMGKDIGAMPLKAPLIAGQAAGRILQSISAPLFEHFIPALKAGAWANHFQEFMRANPNASHEDLVKASQSIHRSIDNRFGEMVQDNIFMNTALKQAATVSMFSYSWTMGTIREIGGGALKAGLHPIQSAKDYSIRSANYDPRLGYVLALPIAIGYMGAAYQYLLGSGEAPQSLKDLYYPRTGGKVQVGKKHDVPERYSIPGYIKDVMGWWHDAYSEALNKRSAFLKIAGQQFSSNPKDWKDQPIIAPRTPKGEIPKKGYAGPLRPATLMENITDRIKGILTEINPITIKNIEEMPKKGSKIGTVQRAMGVREASSWIESPESTEKAILTRRGRDWQERMNFEKRQKDMRVRPAQ